MATTLKLWDNPPLMIEGKKSPTLHYYATNKKSENKGCVLIFPGGGYGSVMMGYEGIEYAEYLNEHGLDAFVLDYRVAPYKFPVPLLDARRAMRVIRYHAKELGINKDKILVMGSSAGGHLAAFVSTYKEKIDGEGVDEIDDISPIPNGQILCYPVIDTVGHLGSYENLLGDLPNYDAYTPTVLADENTPPVFAWHTMRDDIVNVTNTLNYAIRLKELDVSCEMHMFPDGKHGLGLANDSTIELRQEDEKIGKHARSWNELMIKWLNYMNFTN